MTVGGEAERDERSELPQSVIADLRADDRRRQALTRLAECERALPISDLARHVAATERDEPVDEVPADAADAVRRDFFQQHLPKLTATGVVTYDSLVGTVELATDDERLLADDGETDAADETAPDSESRRDPDAESGG
ncbi:DUF7344 domain-containing protein [Halosimplex amylolyticum]|uniref:DUF7344 domain-containing protein n=1 Tax=Halosimplex amylolyticum TaxID=3396616 RepID=UPI003F55ABEC